MDVHYLGGVLFLIGGIIAFIGGALQVLWKIIIALHQKSVAFLHSQMKYSMSVGFLIIISALIIARSSIDWLAIKTTLIHIPCVILIIIIIIRSFFYKISRSFFGSINAIISIVCS